MLLYCGILWALMLLTGTEQVLTVSLLALRLPTFGIFVFRIYAATLLHRQPCAHQLPNPGHVVPPSHNMKGYKSAEKPAPLVLAIAINQVTCCSSGAVSLRVPYPDLVYTGLGFLQAA